MSGEVTATSAIVQTRVKLGGGPERGRFVLSTAPDFADDRRGGELAAAPDGDGLVRERFTALTPDTLYHYRWSPDGGPPGRTGTFRTLPAPDAAAPVRFVVTACINYAKFHGSGKIDRELHKLQNNTELAPPAPKTQRELGYPGLEAIRELDPRFVVFTGDTVYYDTPVEGRAETVAEMRAKWHEQFGQPRFRDLLAAVPVWHMKDDHDFRKDDSDRGGDYFPSPETGIAVFREQLPVVPPGGDMHDPARVPTYRTVRVGRDLQLWLVEGRDYRSRNQREDGPGKTIWGDEQKAWLKDTLSRSDATFKLLISPTPLVGPDDARKSDNHTNFGGFRHERGEFFDWLNENDVLDGTFFTVCGDRHWQYHARHPSGVEEFSTGALDDTNARPGREDGDPASTDPDGNIAQFYLQGHPSAGDRVGGKVSGGFLEIALIPARDGDPASLTFRFHNERGELLYETTKEAPQE